MPIPLDNLIQVSVSVSSPGVSPASFSVPLILGTNKGSSWSSTQRTSTYTSLSGVAADYATTAPEYLAAEAMFAQSPKPASIKIGLRKNLPTLEELVTVTADEGRLYELTAQDDLGTSTTYRYTAQSGDTAQDICSALLAASWAPNTSVSATNGARTFVNANGKNFRTTVAGTTWNGPTATTGTQAEGALVWTEEVALGTPGAYDGSSHSYAANSLVDSGHSDGIYWIAPVGGTSGGATFPTNPTKGQAAADTGGFNWYPVFAWAPNVAHTSGSHDYIYSAANYVYLCTTSGTTYNGPTASSGTHTSDPGGTVQYLALGTGSGLKQNATFSTPSASGGVLTLTGAAAGKWFSVTPNDFTYLSCALDNVTQTDPGVAADLNAIENADGAWYGVISTFLGATDIKNISAWCEANGAIFCFATPDSSAPNVTYDPTMDPADYADDIVGYITGLSLNYTTSFHHPDRAQWLDAALMASRFALPAGSETWDMVNLSGVTAVGYAQNQLATMGLGTNGPGTFGLKKCGIYGGVGNPNSVEAVTLGGAVGGKFLFIDQRRGVDAFVNEGQTEVFDYLQSQAQAGKAAFTNGQIGRVLGIWRTVAEGYAAAPKLLLEPGSIVISAPSRAAQFAAGNVGLRCLKGVTITAEFAGAIQGAQVQITLKD